MGVLDELREQTKRRARLTRAIDELFDAFEAAHPGLKDLTGWGVDEKKYGDGMEHIDAWRRCPAGAEASS